MNLTNPSNTPVLGGQEEGTTTTPSDKVVLNRLDRIRLVMDAVDRVPRLRRNGAYATQAIRDELVDHKRSIRRHGIGMPEVLNWRRPSASNGTA